MLSQLGRALWLKDEPFHLLDLSGGVSAMFCQVLKHKLKTGLLLLLVFVLFGGFLFCFVFRFLFVGLV